MYLVRVLLVITLLFNVSYGDRDDFSNSYFSNEELRVLMSLRGRSCAFTKNTVDDTKLDPWFCVRQEECNDKYRHVDEYNPPPCIDRPGLTESGETHCCFIDNLKINGNKTFSAAERHWGLRGKYDQLFYEYIDNLYHVYTQPYIVHLLNTTKLCGLRPTGVDMRGHPLYTPYLCTAVECEDTGDVFPTEPSVLEKGNQFCDTNQPKCCHPKKVADGLKGSDSLLEYSATADSKDFSLVSLSTRNIQFSFGFRSSFQCEQYSKQVCVKDKDRCSLRILDRTNANPGEMPHQALIGVQEATTRFFHCAGAVVSKYYILSSMLCRYHDRFPANVASIGDYDMYLNDEFGSQENIAYLVEIEVEPSFSGNENQYERARLALFKMWKAVAFDLWLRPACVNWGTRFKLDSAFPQETTVSGYGVKKIGERWSRLVKRHDFPCDMCFDNKDTERVYFCVNHTCNFCNDCRTNFYRQEGETDQDRLPFDDQDVFCQNSESIVAPSKPGWGPCQFDLGAPAAAMERTHGPYCQWTVFGVHVNPKDSCNSNVPALYRAVSNLVPWIENVIYRYDFNLFDFDMSWPKCHNEKENTFRSMHHVSREFDQFYPK